MQVTATLKYAGLSPQKVRLVAREIKGLRVANAIEMLNHMTQKPAFFLKKILNSAISNAEHNHGINIDTLIVKNILVDEAPVLKRFKARAKGRGNRILKRRSNIQVTVVQAA